MIEFGSYDICTFSKKGMIKHDSTRAFGVVEYEVPIEIGQSEISVTQNSNKAPLHIVMKIGALKIHCFVKICFMKIGSIMEFGTLKQSIFEIVVAPDDSLTSGRKSL